MTESLHQRLGSLVLPPDLATVEEAGDLTSFDPARRIMADLFKAAINAELGEAWAVAAGGLPPEPVSRTLPVADVLELEPTGSHVVQRQNGFPLLAVYRSGTGVYEQHTMLDKRLRQPWTVDWILGPADIAAKFQLGDTAVAVAKIIALVCDRSAHPAYQSDAFQFGLDDDNTSGITSIRVVRHQGPGVAKFADGTDSDAYWAITIELETLEVAGEGADAEDMAGIFEGADYDMGLGGEPAGVVHGLFYADSNHPGT